ncbi:hypothetical protein A2824_03370 [Candidatus Nomurabacteria bacterium RIFCSPHIGHO2_01_FULL_42_16]|uniref:Nucleotidase n=1 Tax=Candidatus Nomurabacteria bacterium RIFCSPHIGHO2_01_FULL_42_16 TaxID=1801743 RepID=A0A1F6VIS1_9BACT|nr:MAG: hypothetical protein A2824_03370 [Candidatus Nomurabacteria bacterium RIFCSPHIGHO2_01_FULL_42_16]
MARKIIAIDFDDVICDTSRAFLKFNAQKYKQPFPFYKVNKYYLNEVLNLDVAEEERRWNEFFSNPKFCYPKPRRELLPALILLKKEYKLHISTARSKGWHEQVRKWINTHLPGIFEKIIFCKNLKCIDKSKGPICMQRKYYALVDDNPEEIKSCLECGVKVIVFDQPWNRKIGKTIPRIKSFRELPKFL